jgi:hypothetical protein
VMRMSTPACLSLRWFWMYLSDSAEDIVPGAFPPLLDVVDSHAEGILRMRIQEYDGVKES